MRAAGENRALSTRLMANMIVYNKPLALAVTDGLLNVSTSALVSGKNPNASVEATKALTMVLRDTGLVFGATTSTLLLLFVVLLSIPGTFVDSK